MRRLKNKEGNIVAIELLDHEMAKALDIELEELQEWRKTIPPYSDKNGIILYRINSTQEIQQIKKRVALLKTQMTEQAVENIEKAELLDAYAALAEDCPSGITVHVWRSYGLIVLMQIKYNRMIDAEELAARANLTEINENGKVVISPKTAETHLRLLKGLGYLEIGRKESDSDWTGQWKHQGLPKAWQKDN